MPADFSIETKTLRLTEPFRIAHGSSAERQVLRLRIRTEAFEAVGEAPFVPYYPDLPNETVRWLQGLSSFEMDSDIPSEAPRVARLALDLLRADWRGKVSGEPMGAEFIASGQIQGCRSLSIPTDLEVFEKKVREMARRFRVLKLKLGSGDVDWDQRIVKVARSAAPDAILFADVNGGWSVKQAADLIPKVERLNLEFIEQPISHREGIQAWEKLRGHLGDCQMKLVADESAQTQLDVRKLEGLVEGVNVKMLKCGGWRHAAEMMREARSAGLKVLLGCMIESSIGVTAAAHLAPLADWIDLDGHLYLADDDYEGLLYDEQGFLKVPKRPGIGAIAKR
jgi:L-alanine-DL-glutamate epimerase-like enolase superfamily enzyme